MNNTSIQYDMWMSSIEHFGAKRILRLSRESGLGENLGAFLYHAQEAELKAFLAEYLGENKKTAVLEDLLLHARKAVPEAIAESLWKKKISYVSFHDPAFPEKLRSIPDPPFQLYYYGSLPDSSAAGTAIVGTRMPSIYGKEQTRRFSVSLASAGVQIISGMARGVDGIAGMGCLDAGGRSFAVLGGGVDICYPAENRELYEALKERGGVMSEYNPGLLPQNRFFPARNRIISGLSDVVLVIEAKERSGSLITADTALEQGRDIFAVPGRNGDRTSSGCNNLIRQGAGIAIDPEDILRTLPGYSAFEPESSGQMRMTLTHADNQDGKAAWKKESPGQMPKSTAESPVIITTGSTNEAIDKNDLLPQNQTPGQTLRQLRQQRAKAVSEARTANNLELMYAPAEPNTCVTETLSRLDREILSVLDRSTPYDLEIIASAVSEHMKKQVTGAELIREMTCLILRGLAAEVRIGYYIRT